MASSSKVYTLKQAIEKAQHFCAYQERCYKEVRTKLFSWGIRGEDAEYVISELVEQSFLNEERFARAFTRGKFRMKMWGKGRIKRELEMRDISSFCIQIAIDEEIQEGEYIDAFEEVFNSKWRSLGEATDANSKAKLARYLISKGYESNMIWDKINQIKNNG